MGADDMPADTPATAPDGTETPADPWAEGSTATAEGWSGDIPF